MGDEKGEAKVVPTKGALRSANLQVSLLFA
jgi:hypothetical protein